MAQFPSEIEALVQRGIAAAKEGKNGIAQQLLHKAVELAPTHEQAWLWLSGVEDTDQKRLAALEHVLSINPSSTLARQGIERLTQPKQIDLAQIAASSAAPAPARAAKSAEPPPPPPMPAIKTPTNPLPTPAEQSPMSPKQDPTAPIVEADAETEIRGMQALEDLKPAMELAKKKRSFLPRMSEMVIMAGLLVLLLGAIIGLRVIFNPNRYNLAQDRINRSLEEQTAQAGQPRTQAPVVTQPTIDASQPEITLPPAPPPGNTLTSRSYQLQLGGATVDAEQKSIIVNVSLNNPLQRPLGFSNIDFSARNGMNAGLRLDMAQSTLFAGDKTIPANGVVSGSLVFVGDMSRTPITLIWQPQSGGVREEIPIQ